MLVAGELVAGEQVGDPPMPQQNPNVDEIPPPRASGCGGEHEFSHQF